MAVLQLPGWGPGSILVVEQQAAVQKGQKGCLCCGWWKCYSCQAGVPESFLVGEQLAVPESFLIGEQLAVHGARVLSRVARVWSGQLLSSASGHRSKCRRKGIRRWHRL